MKTIAVRPWPGRVPALVDGVFVIGVRTDVRRPRAREQIRQALREALAAVLGAMGEKDEKAISADDIGIVSTPGEPPRITGLAHLPALHCSITHDEGYALAAVNLYGAVGVDLMDASLVPHHGDWDATAQDYLGPAVTDALHALPASQQRRAFAQAWAEYEAWLKCDGRQLTEWSGERVIGGRSVALRLQQEDLVGALHYKA